MANAYDGILGSRRMGGKKNLHLIHTTRDAWEIIKERARQLGLTQKELADMGGMSELALTLWNREGKQPRIEGIQRICTALGIQMEIGLRIQAAPEQLQSYLRIKQKEKEVTKARKSLAKQIKQEQRDNQSEAK